MAIINSRYNWIFKYLKKGKVLNLGFAGKGNHGQRIVKYLKKFKKKSILISGDYNQARVLEENLPLSIVLDANKLPFGKNIFDQVLIGEVIEHFYNPATLLKQIYDVLRPGGEVIITTPNPFNLFRLVRYWFLSGNITNKKTLKQAMGDPTHCIFWDPFSLQKLLITKGFKVKVFKVVNFQIHFLPAFICRFADKLTRHRFGENFFIVAKKIK